MSSSQEVTRMSEKMFLPQKTQRLDEQNQLFGAHSPNYSS